MICFLIYKLFFIVEYINKNDNQNINCSRMNKLLISSISTFFILLIYLKQGFSLEFFIYAIAFIFLVFIGYIDYKTSYVYEVMTKPFLLFGSFIFFINIILGHTGLKEIGYGLSLIIFLKIMEKTNSLGGGDVEVFTALFLIFSSNYIMPVIIVLMSMGISGIAGLFLLFKKKADLNYRKPLCPSIAAACLIIILLI